MQTDLRTFFAHYLGVVVISHHAGAGGVHSVRPDAIHPESAPGEMAQVDAQERHMI